MHSSFTLWLQGTKNAFTQDFTFLPANISAAILKSSILQFVQLPIKT